MNTRTALVVGFMLLSTMARAEFVSVAARKVNVRSGPGRDYAVLWESWRYTPFEVLEWGGDWAKLRDFEGDVGWIHSAYLVSQPCVIVIGKYANLREGPALEYDVLWRVEREYPLRVLEYEGDWIRVSDGVDIKGWINKSLVWGSKTHLEFGV